MSFFRHLRRLIIGSLMVTAILLIVVFYFAIPLAPMAAALTGDWRWLLAALPGILGIGYVVGEGR